MELKEFLKAALVDIINGVEDAKKDLGEKDQFVCAPLGNAYREEFKLHFDAVGRYFQKVEFDVAVTAESESSI